MENIEVALKSATMEYLDNHIGIDEEKNEVSANLECSNNITMRSYQCV